MAKGASQSQAASVVAAGRGSGGSVGPRGSAPTASGIRRRRLSSGSSGGGGGSSGFGGSGNVLRFYTEDTPGLKMTPTMVLVMSVCFIAFVTALHVVGKLYHYKTAA